MLKVGCPSCQGAKGGFGIACSDRGCRPIERACDFCRGEGQVGPRAARRAGQATAQSLAPAFASFGNSGHRAGSAQRHRTRTAHVGSGEEHFEVRNEVMEASANSSSRVLTNLARFACVCAMPTGKLPPSSNVGDRYAFRVPHDSLYSDQMESRRVSRWPRRWPWEETRRAPRLVLPAPRFAQAIASEVLPNSSCSAIVNPCSCFHRLQSAILRHSYLSP